MAQQKLIGLEVIPQGIYCYSGKVRCPHWSQRGEFFYCEFLREAHEGNGPEPTTKPESGYAHVTEFSLLWDQVKECGENEQGRSAARRAWLEQKQRENRERLQAASGAEDATATDGERAAR